MSFEPSGPKIAIIGIGKVGAAVAYSVIHKGIASEVLILDVKEDFQEAQVEDLRDSTSFGLSPRVRAGTWQECGQCDIVIFTAGTNQKPGESRLALLQRNLTVIKSGFNQMRPFREDTILLMVTNPVDIMTYFALKYSGLPVNQVIGSGTILDTTRLKDLLAQKTGLAPRSVHGYVVGEHGDSQTIAWSNIAMGGIPMDQILPLDADEKAAIGQWIRTKADRLNKVKGETSFGIGAVCSSICTSILLDERNVLPLSHWQDEHSICFSSPVVIGRRGICKSLPLSLNHTEQVSLGKSIAKLTSVIASTEQVAPTEQIASRL